MAAIPLYVLILSGTVANPSWVKVSWGQSAIVVPGNSFSWDSSAARIISPLLDSGYAFASLSVVSSRISDDTLELETRMDSGFVVTVHSLAFRGERYTKPALLAYLADFESFRFSPSRVMTVASSLSAVDCQVLDWELLGLDSSVTLDFLIREKRTPSRFNALLGYSSKESLVGSADISIANVLGWREELALSGQRLSRYSLSFSLTARVPHPLLLPFGLEASSFIRSYDTISYHLEASGGVFLKKKFFDISLGYGYELDRVDTLLVTKNLGVTRFKAWGFTLDLRAGERRALRQSTYLRALAGLDLSIPLPWHFSIGFNPNAGLVYSSDSLINTELIPLGGARTLRGYAEEEFRAHSLFWSRQELRWGSDAFRIYPLFDFAWIPTDTVLAAYGAGITVATPIGRLELDLALPWAASWVETKVHLSLTSEF
jgi:outer membrane protein assembly factor BamA